MILVLPNELLLSVASWLDSRASLAALCLVCRRLHSLLNARLYWRDVLTAGSSALCWAASNGVEATAALSIDAGADVLGHGCDRPCCSPLELAAKNGHDDIVRRILTVRTAQSDPRDPRNRAPLSAAASQPYVPFVDRLASSGRLDLDSTDACGRTPLIWAAINGRVAVIRRLLQSGMVDARRTDAHGHTAMFYAALYRRESAYRLLLSWALRLRTKDDLAATLRAWAATAGDARLWPDLWS